METSQPDVTLRIKSGRIPKGILLAIVTLLIGIFIGVVANRFLLSKPAEPVSQQPTTSQISQKDSPIAFSLLKNPIITQWRGGVEGTLAAKDVKTITLSKNGHNITIPVDEKTVFVDLTIETGGEFKKTINLNDLVIGSYLRGEFFTTPQLDKKDIIYGSLFSVEKKP